MFKGFALAAVAGMLAIALVGGILYGVVLLVLAVSWRGELSARGGAITGGLLGFLMAASYDLSQFGTLHHWTLKLTLIEPFIAMTTVAAAGAVVGVVLGRSKASAARRA
jgi:uncharacterized membrane protein